MGKFCNIFHLKKIENENPCQTLYLKNIVGMCSSESNSPIFIGYTMFILVNFSILGYVWVDRIGQVLNVSLEGSEI